jgi:hypothetical protein
MKWIRASLLVLIPTLLSACMSPDVRQYGKIDNTEKSITVPPGGGLVAELKDVLIQHGWTLVVDRGPDVIEGKNSESVKLKSYNTFNSRYRLLLAANRFDTCLSMDGAYRYSLSMIDNKTGQEVMVMGGSACEYQIKSKFESFLTSGN